MSIYSRADPSLGVTPGVALAVTWFAVGFALAAPLRLRRVDTRVPVMILIVVTAGLAVEEARHHPAIATSLCAAAATAILRPCLSRSRHRAFATTPTFALPRSLAPPRANAFAGPVAIERHGTPRLGRGSLVHRCLDEKFARHRGGLWTRSVSTGAFAVLWLLVVAGMPFQFDGPWADRTSRELYHALVAPLDSAPAVEGATRPRRPPDPWAVAGFLALWCFAHAATYRVGFLRGELLPLSRTERARVAWRTGLVMAAAALTAVCVAMTGGALLSYALSTPPPLHAPPTYLRALLLCAIGFPLAQLHALIAVSPDEDRDRGAAIGNSVIAGALFCAAIASADAAWSRAERVVPGAVLYGFGIAAVIVAWSVQRRWLARWFARADLV